MEQETKDDAQLWSHEWKIIFLDIKKQKNFKFYTLKDIYIYNFKQVLECLESFCVMVLVCNVTSIHFTITGELNEFYTAKCQTYTSQRMKLDFVTSLNVADLSGAQLDFRTLPFHPFPLYKQDL